MIIILGILVTFLFVMWKWFVMLSESKKLKVPGPTPVPILGNGHLLMVKSTEFLNVLGGFFNNFGDVIRIHLLSQVYIITRQPDVIEEIVTNNELGTKGTSYVFLKPFLGDGLLTSTGFRWKNHRKFLTPAFHFNILQDFLQIFIRNEKIMIKKLKELDDGEPLDLFPFITLAALDNVIESIMGVAIDAQQGSESTYVKNIEVISGIVSERMRNISLAVDFIFKLTPYYRQQTKALAYLHNYTRKVMNARREELKNEKITHLDEQPEIGIKNKYAFLDLLLLAEVNGQKISDEWIREEVDTFLFEGHDTTSSGIVYTLYCIAKYPEVQEKIFMEQKEIFKNDFTTDVTSNDLQLMKYLNLVIKEALRLYPPVPLIERLVTKDIGIGGYNLKKGSSIILDIFHLQRHPAYFEDPLKFNPDRFEDEKLTNHFAWLAFSAGSRNCIGQKFAIMEMKVVISAIVRNFVLSAVDRDIDFTANLILKSPSGVYVTVKPRKLISP